MSITLERALASSIEEIDEAVASWQHDGRPVQIHPGDIGWNAMFGAQTLAGELRIWRRDGLIAAVAMADDGVARFAIAPALSDDETLARQFLADLSDPGQGVLPSDRGVVEARYGSTLRKLLASEGWTLDEPWTPLVRSLIEPVEQVGVRLETLDADAAPEDVLRDRVAVQRAAFAGSKFSEERWHAMAASPAYRRARCLVGYDEAGNAVAATTVWSAGVSRPGLIEPLGVHRDHRGHGWGRAITLAAAAALRDLGSSSVAVCTPSRNVGGVAAYVSAGFDRMPDVHDFRKPT